MGIPNRERELRDAINTQPRDVQYLLGVIEEERQAGSRERSLAARERVDLLGRMGVIARENAELKQRLGIQITNISTGEDVTAAAHPVPYPDCVPCPIHPHVL